jgi:hypothetical protein
VGGEIVKRKIARLLAAFLFFWTAVSCGGEGDGSDGDDDEIGDDDDVDDDDTDDDVDDDAGDDDTWPPLPDDDADDDAEALPRIVPDKCLGEAPPDWGGFDPDYIRVNSGEPVQDKSFYLLTLLRQIDDLADALAGDSALAALSAERDDAFRDAAASCGADVDCYAAALQWGEIDIDEAAEELVRLFLVESADPLVAPHMRPAGDFQLYDAETDEDLLTAAWRDALGALNGVFDRFARALPAATLDELAGDIADAHPAPLALFEPLLMVGIESMLALDRDEAGRYEPLAEGENRAAVERIPTIDWDAFRFPVMLVPGQGPEIEGLPLSGLGRWRCDLAAHRYLAGVTPLIVFSGGHVHPDQTPFSEAVEMKRYVMDEYGIPESAILIDPHARHTTTNLRNLVRFIARLGIPSDRPALVTTDLGQAFYIEFMLNGRCDEELGYRPYRLIRRVTSTDACMLVNPTSLYADARDPLDP